MSTAAENGVRGSSIGPTKAVHVRYLSDVNLRAVLNVLIGRAGGTVDISNAELYGAMLPDSGQAEGFHVEELPDRLRLTLAPRPDSGRSRE